MKALIVLLDCLHIPLIIIGIHFAVIAGALAVGLLYVCFCWVLLEFFSQVMGLDNSFSLWLVIYGPPIFAGFMGIVWVFVRGFLITDRLVNYLDKAEDSTKACREINSKVVKGVPQANAETAPAMIINKIREKFYRKQ